MGVLNPSGKILGSGLTYPLRGYIDGLITANAADADHDITINDGEATDSTKSTLMTLYSPLTKQIDATWSQGTNAGGLFPGVALANSTWYHMFEMKHSSGAIDCGFDTSVIAANRPSGWNYYRRIGSVLTNGSANIIAFIQMENQFLWKVPIADVSGGTLSTAAVTPTLSTPLGIKTTPNIAWLGLYKGAGLPNAFVSAIDQTDSAVTFPTQTHGNTGSAGNLSPPFSHEHRIWTNTSSQIRIRSNLDGVTYYLATAGWIDPRGKDA